eukprot:TRINITY_DN2264_c1_g1_i1.p1 TRINITY_DN2264_c1_g1~~TRINITY_DN2264_c1_g1_i1.p1  ORF type:complete len:296 (+),score=67.23 TRINITY_DN2264_c1_g1_i1:78-890(+)
MGNAQRAPAIIHDLEEDDNAHPQEANARLTVEEVEETDVLAEFRVVGKIDLQWSDSEEYTRLFNKLQPTAAALLCKPIEIATYLQSKSISVKVAVVGKTAVGKTSTILNCCGFDVPESHTETAGLQTTICHHPVKLSMDGQVALLRFHFWDCGSIALQRYEYLRKSMLYDVDICLFCFSLQDKDSLDTLPQLIKKTSLSQDVIRIVVGTRLDQRYTLPYSERYLYESITSLNLPFVRLSNLPKSHLNNMGRRDVTELLNIMSEFIIRRKL